MNCRAEGEKRERNACFPHYVHVNSGAHHLGQHTYALENVSDKSCASAPIFLPKEMVAPWAP